MVLKYSMQISRWHQTGSDRMRRPGLIDQQRIVRWGWP